MYQRFLVLISLLISVLSLNAQESLDYSKYYKQLTIKSPKAIIYDAETGDVIYEKKANEKSSIASLTKLMTAMVIIDSNLDLNETVTITKDDFDPTYNKYKKIPKNFSYNSKNNKEFYSINQLREIISKTIQDG